MKNKKLFLTIGTFTPILSLSAITTTSCLIKKDKTALSAIEYGKNHHFLTIERYDVKNNKVGTDLSKLEDYIRDAKFGILNDNTMKIAYKPQGKKYDIAKIKELKISYEDAFKLHDYYFQDTPYRFIFLKERIIEKESSSTWTLKTIDGATPSNDLFDLIYFNKFISVINPNNEFKVSYTNLIKEFIKNNLKINHDNKEKGITYAFPPLFLLRNLDLKYSNPSIILFNDKLINSSNTVEEFINDPEKFVKNHKDYFNPLASDRDIKNIIKKNIKDYGSTEETIIRSFAYLLFFKRIKDIQIIQAYDKDENKIVYYLEKLNKENNTWEIFDFFKDLAKIKSNPQYEVQALKSKPNNWVFEIPASADINAISNYSKESKANIKEEISIFKEYIHVK